MKRLALAVVCLGVMALALPAAAAPAKPAPKPSGKNAGKAPAGEPLPPGTVGSGVIDMGGVSTLQNISINIRGPKDKSGQAVIVRTVLPKDWTYVENGRKKDSAELDPSIGVYTMLAKPPTKDSETDFAYELRVYPNNLTDGPFESKDPASGKTYQMPEKDRNSHGMFTLYLNTMINEYIKAKYKSNSALTQIQPKPFGALPDPKTGKLMMMASRPSPMYFVPISFTHPDSGETIYTFTGVVGDKIVSLRFLVAKDQSDNYVGTIAYIVNNTWGLTLDQDSQWGAEMNKRHAEAEAKQKAQKGNKPSGGGKSH